MKTFKPFRGAFQLTFLRNLGLGTGLFTFCLSASLLSTPTSPLHAAEVPLITSIQNQNQTVRVEVLVPAGIKKITLEGRSRIGAGNWVPRGVKHLDGKAQTVLFEVPLSREIEIFRVSATTQDLPSQFLTHRTEFSGQPTSSQTVPGAINGPEFRTPDSPELDASNSPNQVVESDIWKQRDSTLYFFNQNRGLQIIDLGNPDSPQLLGTYNLPAAGEQMHLLGEDNLLLLAREQCGWDWNNQTSNVLLLQDQNGKPALLNSHPIQGSISENRLIGDVLYVAAQSYKQVDPAEIPPGRDDGLVVSAQWEWGTSLTAIDYSIPESPMEMGVLWFPGYNNTIAANNEYLFVSTRNTTDWRSSTLFIIEIGNPNAPLEITSQLQFRGFLNDKFKIQQNGEVLTLIYQSWNTALVSTTVLETFSLENPLVPRALGRLTLAERETLHATRFDGDKVYIVTFLQTDPLWIVSLEDPANPQIVGELEVPGWSTYIQPLGDGRLVSVGIDNVEGWRVGVSLFDVSNPANPTRLSNVSLGENNSWSEANWDEKAFSVLPDEGLIMVPYQGDQGGVQYGSWVQLIDLNQNDLTLRGAIQHELWARRSTLYQDHVYSLSNTELLTVDIQDRDQPEVVSKTELSWVVNQILVLNHPSSDAPYLIQVTRQGENYNVTAPQIRITSSTTPEETLLRIPIFEDHPIANASLQFPYLYVTQVKSDYGYIDPVKEEEDTSPNLFFTIYDLTDLNAIEAISQLTLHTQPLGWAPQITAHTPQPGLMVLTGNQNAGIFWWGRGVFVGDALTDIAIPWYPYQIQSFLLALDISNPLQPRFASELNLNQSDIWGYSESFSNQDGLILHSYQRSVEIVGADFTDNQPPPPGMPFIDPTTGDKLSRTDEVARHWEQRYFLQVIDYADPENPELWPPINLPGKLVGIHQVTRSGGLLFAQGYTYSQNGLTDWKEKLFALAFDGVNAHLLDSLELPTLWPHPVAIHEGNAFIANPIPNAQALEVWTISTTGKWNNPFSASLGVAADILVPTQDLLLVQEGSEIRLFELGKADHLPEIGRTQTPGCLWVNLEQAVGSKSQGLWIPMDSYGTFRIPLTP